MLVLAGGVVALLVGNHQQSVEAAERLHGVGSSAVAADPAAADPAVVGQAAQEKAAADQAAQEKAAREKAAREQAAADQAARKKAAREQAAADQAAADQAAQEKAAADQAAREKAAADQAAADQAAREKAAAAPHVIAGEMTAPGINGALVTQFGGYPGQPLNEFGMRDLNRLEAMINSLERGRTYPCPGGSGGGYDDIVAGAQVVVEDGTGAVLATTTLRGGRVNMQGCTFTFKVEVPDMPFYRIEVTHRGAITYSRADLNRDGWRVGMRL